MGFISILSLSALLMLAARTAEAEEEKGHFPCGYSYISKAGAWFKMHTQPAVWEEAKYICHSEGAYLASPSNAPMTKAIKMLMLVHKNQMPNWMIHTDLLAVVVNAEEADRKGKFISAYTGQVKYQEVSRYVPLPFICYKTAPVALQVNECGTTDPEYKYNNRTNKCYKFHRNRNTWLPAAESCASEGGYLAIINSEEEAKVIEEIFADNPADVIEGVDVYKDTAYVGYWTYKKSMWKTVLGEDPSELGYNAWSPGEPNNISGDEFCAVVGRNGKLLDDYCDLEALAYICEKDITSCVSC